MPKSGVDKIWTRYKNGGTKGIKSKKCGVRDGKKINGQQSAEIRRLIKDKMPDQLKLPFGLWTREAVGELISKKFGVELSRWQVGRYLKDWLIENQEEIEVSFIPSDGQELNAQEYLNQDVKTKIIGKKRPTNKAQMKSNVETFMQKRKINKTQEKKYYHGKHVKYAA